MACRQKRYPRNNGRRDRRRVPPRRHHASTVGRNSSSPFPASWSYTSCSELLCVQRTRQRGTTTPLTASDKASPPLVSIPFPGPETNDHNLWRACPDRARTSRPPPTSALLSWTSVVRGGMSPGAPARRPPQGIRVPGQVAVVLVEHEAHDLRRLHDLQRFLQQLPGRPVSRHHDEEAVHPFADHPAIRDRDER